MWIFKLLMNMYTQDYRLQFRKTLCLFSPQKRFITIQSHWGSQLQVQTPVIPKIQLLKTMRSICDRAAGEVTHYIWAKYKFVGKNKIGIWGTMMK